MPWINSRLLNFFIRILSIVLSLVPAFSFIVINSTFGAQGEVEISVHHLIAVPYEQLESIFARRGLGEGEKNQLIDELALQQAHVECKAHSCNSTPCQGASQTSHSIRSASGGSFRKAHLVTLPGAWPGTSSSWNQPRLVSDELSEISKPDHETKEVVFTHITCSSQETPSASHLIHSVRALNEAAKMQPIHSCDNQPPKTTFAQKVSNALYPAACLVAGAAARGILDYVSTPQANEPALVQFCKYAAKSTGAVNVIGNKLDEVIQGNRNKLTPVEMFAEKDKEFVVQERELESLKEKYASLKKQGKFFKENEALMDHTLKTIQRKIGENRKNLGNQAYQLSNMAQANNPKDSLKLAREILSLPTEVKKIDVETARPKLEHLLKDYSPEFQEEQSDFLEKVVDASLADPSDESSRKNSIYYFGGPGTGKTKLARGIAAALGVPFLETTLGKKTPKELFDEIDEFLKSCPVKNPIIFIDEASDALNPKTKSFHANSMTQDEGTMSGMEEFGNRTDMTTELLPFTEPENKKFISPSSKDLVRMAMGGMGVSQEDMKFASQGMVHDISRVTLIMAGNAPILDSALKRRVRTATFEKFKFPLRKSIAQDLLTQKLDKYKIDPKKLTPEDHKIFERIIERDHQKHDGVGVLGQVLDAFAIHKKKQIETPTLNLFGKQDSKKNVTSPFNIESAFSKFEVSITAPVPILPPDHFAGQGHPQSAPELPAYPGSPKHPLADQPNQPIVVQ